MTAISWITTHYNDYPFDFIENFNNANSQKNYKNCRDLKVNFVSIEKVSNKGKTYWEVKLGYQAEDNSESFLYPHGARIFTNDNAALEYARIFNLPIKFFNFECVLYECNSDI